MSDRLHLFGIRHHGPGCAHSLRRALDRLDPQAVLIEGPPEGESVAAFAASAAMQPPLAMLVHARDRPARASFFPFAEYSPEWVALRWALARGRVVRFIDLPAAINLAERDEEVAAESAEAPPAETEAEAIDADPLSYLAALAGYADGETWWNNLIEQGTHDIDLFAAVAAAMTALRERLPADPATPRQQREAQREAQMRLSIADALDSHAGPLAAVVGAWHVPALRQAVPAKTDRASLKGLPRTDVVATWVPWTDTRLAGRSGYGAGVISPGWYRHLWGALGASDTLDRRALVVGWTARVAALLREEGLPASTASVIDAVRLAEALAGLRDLATPGLAELQAAILATLCGGNEAPLRLIQNKLVIGTRVGAIDPAVPLMPLLADLARWQKRLRLVADAAEAELSLDLRSEAGLAKSTLLHRLILIAVPWGRLLDAGGSRGSFRERWALVWQPELAVALAEALRWGTTIEDAAAGAAVERAANLMEAAPLAELIRAVLLADLPQAAERCIDRLQAVAAQSGEVGSLMAAVAPLADVLRYGTARRLPELPLRRLVKGLVAEVCIGLPLAVRQLDADATEAMQRQAASLDRALPLLDDAGLTADWQRALATIAADTAAAGRLRGFAQRKLYDAQVSDGDATAAALSRALSPAVAPAEAAHWLDGFLDDSGRLLLHDALLRNLLDGWVRGLDGADLEALLPQLRRAFSDLDATERRRLLSAMQQAPATAPPPAEMPDAPAFAAALPLLKNILGLPP